MSTKYVDLGAGYFLTDGRTSLEHEVCDANSPDPDISYGPAAWGGGVGPASARRLLFLEAVCAAEYRTASDAYDFADGPYPEEPSPWPARATVMAAGATVGLGPINGRVFETEAEFCAAVRAITRFMPRKVWTGASSAARAEAAKFRYPHAFGDEDTATFPSRLPH